MTGVAEVSCAGRSQGADCAGALRLHTAPALAVC